MARPLRIEFPGAFYHVMNRGNTGMNIYRSERDREKFLEYVGEAVKRYGIKVNTYCLMTTHYHFLIETPHPNLSQAIKWINVGYSVYFNRKRRRFGHLFQGRFKAVLVDADEYLKHLSRYIHLNPVRARMVEHCRDYFVNWVKKTFLSKESNSREIPQLKILKPRPTPDDLIQAVSDEFGCAMENILRKGKKRNLARDVAIYLCREMTGETSVVLGRRFDISGAGIAARHDRIAKKLETDRKLKGQEDRIRRKILNI